ncbi:hypothetical protein MMC29_005510 [Sticta canariensis]|nr:hypothetical protein [Sticta canariensis]
MAFRKLPVEMLENVASYLTDDKDLCRFASICPETYAAVHSNQSGVWRTRFAFKYDSPLGKTAPELKKIYTTRCTILNKQVLFYHGRSSEEQKCLRIIRDLVIDSFSNGRRGASGESVSNNITCLRYFVRRSNLLQSVFGWPSSKYKSNNLLQVIQLLFMHWSLEFSLDCPTYGFPNSQRAVYSHPNELPMFGDYKLDVNIELLLHIANFFKYHLTSEEEATLFYPFKDLAADQKPRTWKSRIGQGLSEIGSTWKGSYAYLHDANLVENIRSAVPGSGIFTDSIDYQDGFQTLKLDFNQANCKAWPRDFEKHLDALPSALLSTFVEGHAYKRPRRGRDYLLFTGTGIDAEPFRCSGVLHGLPKQEYIPGWQRITMMKYFDLPTPPSSSVYATALNPIRPGWVAYGLDGMGGSSIDMSGNNYWAYEGVVLPGGMMMLGRWWSPLDNQSERLSIGPFIFWNVPEQDMLES